MSVPCGNCTERHALCHADCDRYLTWANEYKKPAKQNAELKYDQRPISKSDFDAMVVDLEGSWT